MTGADRNETFSRLGVWNSRPRGMDTPIPEGLLPRTMWAGPSLPLLGEDVRERAAIMEPSEQVTWERCPTCGQAAAVGWSHGRPIEFDCPDGCCLNTAQIQALADIRWRPPATGLTRS